MANYYRKGKNTTSGIFGSIMGIPSIVWLGLIAYFLFKRKSEPNRTQWGVDLNVKPTLTENQAYDYANKIKSSVEDYGTDEDVLTEIFSSINEADLSLIHEAFGLKLYNKTAGIIEEPLFGVDIFGYSKKMSMAQILKEEIHEYNDAELYLLVKNLYKKLNYTF